LSELTRNSLNFYYQNFSKIHLKLGDKILKEGDPNNMIYLIDEGEYSLSFRKSINDIDYIIKKLNPTFNYKKVEDSFEKGLDIISLQSYMNNKHHHTLGFVSRLDIAGLNDYIINDNIIFTLECISLTGIVYYIRSSIFKILLKRELTVQENTKSFTKFKINKYVEKLITIRNSLMKSYYDLSKVKQDVPIKNSSTHKHKVVKKRTYSVEVMKIQCKKDNKFDFRAFIQKPVLFGASVLPQISETTKNKTGFNTDFNPIKKPEENIFSIFKKTLQHNVNRKQTTLITQDENLFSEVNTDYDSNTNTFYNKTKNLSHHGFKTSRSYNQNKHFSNIGNNFELNIIDYNNFPYKEDRELREFAQDKSCTNNLNNSNNNQYLEKNHSTKTLMTYNKYHQLSDSKNGYNKSIEQIENDQNNSIFMKTNSMSKLKIHKLFSKIPLQITPHAFNFKNPFILENIPQKEIILDKNPKKLKKNKSLPSSYNNSFIIEDVNNSTVKNAEKKKTKILKTKHNMFRFSKV